MPVEFPSPVEFISTVNINPGNELSRLDQAEIDLPYSEFATASAGAVA
jgi:hypothetical protein